LNRIVPAGTFVAGARGVALGAQAVIKRKR